MISGAPEAHPSAVPVPAAPGRRRARPSVRRLMALVAVAALAFGVGDQVRTANRAAWYRRKAKGYERIERRCRAIAAMDDATRAREAEAAYDDPYLDNPAWTRRMIPYVQSLKIKYDRAARNPRLPVEPDPPVPW